MINIIDYMIQTSSLSLQFDLSRKSLNLFKSNPKDFSKYCKQQLNTIYNNMKYSKKKISLKKIHQEFYSSTQSNTENRITELYNRINQNEYILVFSLFEIFLKKCITNIFKAYPNFLNPDRDIKLGKIISNDKETILKEEISREINIFDRKSPIEKGEYFLKKFKIDIDITNDKGLSMLKQYEINNSIRNKLIHEDPNLIVNDNDLQLLLGSSIIISTIIVYQGHSLFPDVFEDLGNFEV